MKRNPIRVNVRRQPICALLVVHAESGEPLGSVVDVHTNGLCLRGHRRFARDEVVRIEIAMPKGARSSGPIRTLARCAWTRDVGEDDLVDVGFAFERVESASSAALAELALRFSQ